MPNDERIADGGQRRIVQSSFPVTDVDTGIEDRPGHCYSASKLPGFTLRRVRFMKRQNSSISATRSNDFRIASASVLTPSALRARRIAASSTKKAFRFKLERATGEVDLQAYILGN